MKAYFFSFLAIIFFASSLFGQTISSIQVEGQRKVEKSAIISLISSKAGSKLDKKLIAQDIEKLYELGYFSEVAFYKEAESQNSLKTYFKTERKTLYLGDRF